MIRGTIFLAVFLLGFPAVPARAADLKLGFIDSERIFAEFHGTKDAQSQFNQQVEQWNKELEGKKQELDQLQKDYESQSLILSEPKRREREEEIQKKRSELDAFTQDIWGPTGKVAKRNQELTQPIVDKIREVLTNIGQSEGYSIIFDATDGNIVYANDAFDLTDRVVAVLNEDQGTPQQQTPPAQAPQGQNK
jgi:outer membrane protein